MFPYDEQNNYHTQDFGAPAPTIPQREESSTDHQMGDHGFLGNHPGLNVSTTAITERQRLISFGTQQNKEAEANLRKFRHREIERQRRQEMSNLCGSLRTLLPLEYIKGKRSVSDNMQEAVNYVNDMRNNIQHLKARRDKLQKKSAKRWGGENSWHNLPNYVTVNQCLNGVEILINTGLEGGQGFPVSRILAELHDRGFSNVVSCVSTKADERSLHRIQLEASNPTFEVLYELQQRLTYLINCPF